MTPSDAHDYHLTPLSRPLGRRQGCLATTGVIALFTPIVLIGVSIDNARVRPGFLVGCLAVMAVSIVVNRAVYFLTPPSDRALIAGSQRRHLGPLDPIDRGEVRRVGLKLRRRARRLSDPSQHVIVVDGRGLTVPLWALCWRPRVLKRTGESTLTIEWTNIATWRVRSDSEGPDTYDIETRRPWYETDKTHWPVLRIDRALMLDEIELLDAVRSLGQLPIQLETSLPTSN